MKTWCLRILKFYEEFGAPSGESLSRPLGLWKGEQLNSSEVMGREVFLEPPEHLDGVDDAHVGVVEVVQRTQGEGRQRPNQTDTNVWYDRATVEQGRPNVINNDGLYAPV